MSVSHCQTEVAGKQYAYRWSRVGISHREPHNRIIIIQRFSKGCAP